MSRSGYSDDYEGDQWDLIRWRGAVKSALRGKRGQAFLREMLAALDAIEDKRLIPEALKDEEGEVCALGSVGVVRKMDLDALDPDDHYTVADAFGIPHAMACEIMYENDEGGLRDETPEARYARVRGWVEKNILVEVSQ
jgi:hypothetical protein